MGYLAGAVFLCNPIFRRFSLLKDDINLVNLIIQMETNTSVI